MTHEDMERWAQGLEEVMDRIGVRFGRVEPRRRALAYLRGLLSPVERKNGWQLAEAAGDRTSDGVQDFLARAQWEADLVRDDLRAYMVAQLPAFSANNARLHVDEKGLQTRAGARARGGAKGQTGY
jgi:SRSO17 transposase